MHRRAITLLSSLACLFSLGLATSGSVHAQTPVQTPAPAFPAKPVRITTPFPVGSGPEGVLRLVADKLSKRWGQPVVVENKPGANGFIAIEQFKNGAADGHDLIQLDGVHLTAYPHLFKRLPYDSASDFEPLYPLFKTYFFMTTAVDSKYKRVSDVIADARAQPGKLNYGSWSVGNPVHLGSALLETVTGTQMQHVIYKETSQLYTAVATGELAFALGTSATAGPLYRAGKLKFLAVAAPRRIAGYPDVPTFAEAGGPKDFEVSGWTTIAAPKNLPRAVSEKITRDIAAVLAEPEFKDKYQSFGYEMFPATREQFAQYIRAESVKQAEVIRKAKAQLD